MDQIDAGVGETVAKLFGRLGRGLSLQRVRFLYQCAYPVNLIHDEIVVECRASVAEEMSGILKDCMVKGMEFYLKKVPVVVEVKTGCSWAEKLLQRENH